MPTLQKAVVHGARSSETTIGTTYTFTNGYGQMTRAGAEVQRGATVHADVKIVMRLVTNESTKRWFDEHKDKFTAEQTSTIQHHLDKKNTASGWNAIFAHGAKGSSNENYFKNASAQHENTHEDSQEKIVESASKLQSSKVKVEGTVDIVGVSMLPTRAFIFAEITTIQFADGTQMQVINQADPMAAGADGDTSSVEAKPAMLHIVPAGD